MERKRRGNEAFYGDSGTMLPEQARDEIEQNMGAGHRGNNVDFSQRYAQSESDEHTERAENLVRDMERNGIQLGNARDEFVANMAEHFRGGPSRPAQPQEPEEKPFSSNSFWGDPEEVKRAGRAVRPPKL
jgi:hypothetical protein